MKIYGIDFTSRPRRSKPITCLECELETGRLQAVKLHEWPSFEAFEATLQKPGPWIAGLDFPFGQSRRFIETIGWPDRWSEYVRYAKGLGRKGFRTALDDYRKNRLPGDKEHRRATDIAAGSISPQKLYGTPVGLMFFEGAPRLLESGVAVPGLQQGDPDRIVVEAYPGILARTLIGRTSYKQDTRAKQTKEHHQARRTLLRKILDGEVQSLYGITVTVNESLDLTSDPGGDHIDALLCSVQAGWAWTRRQEGFGLGSEIDPIEGWIADPRINDRK
ncbi:MAG: DUF429 domain-containing protein [Gammaproteobacteria bacterium]